MELNLKQRIKSSWLFDPEEGIVVREPLAPGEGNWVGAPGAFLDGEDFYLTYRYRRPRGQGRGIESRIARSQDGVHFEDIWSVHQQDLQTSSVERFALDKTGEGYILFASYVDPVDNRWRVDRIIAARPDQFDVARRETLFVAPDVGLEAIKDPVIVHTNGLSWMFLSGAVIPSTLHMTPEKLHESQDVYTTGLIQSMTGVAVSRDGIRYEWVGPVLTPSHGRWDGYAARITTVLGTEHGYWAFYDGGANANENYEERTGVAVSGDLSHWTKLSTEGPWLVSPHGTGAMRYVDYALKDGVIYFYYEYARPDGAHDLRVTRIRLT